MAKKKSVTPPPAAPGHATEKFLVVKVGKGATKDDVVKAVGTALKSNDVPFFKDRTHAAAAQKAQAQGAADALQPDDALLMLVKQEGWSPGNGGSNGDT